MGQRATVRTGQRERVTRAKSWLTALGTALALLAVPACCLTRPPDAETLIQAGDSGYRTPEAAFETFRAAFSADLPRFEYRSFSMAWKRANQVSYATYRIARQQLLDSKPYLAFLANAKVVGGSEISARRHRLIVKAAGKSFQVELIREDRFQIYSGGDFLADGELDFDAAVQVRDAAPNQRVIASVDVPKDEAPDLSAATSFLVESVWKIDGFGDAPAPAPR